METSIMLTREPDGKRARESDAGHIQKQKRHSGGQNVLTDWWTAHGQSAERALLHFYRSYLGKS